MLLRLGIHRESWKLTSALAAPAVMADDADAPGDKVPDKRALCLEMLSEGYVQAFVDFFYLTHRPEPEYNPDYLPHQQPKNKEIPAGDQMMIKKNLIQAEGTRRQGETGKVYDSYQALAKYFEESSDYKTAVYFYEKCWEISNLTANVEGEATAYQHLGIVHDSLKDLPTSISFHEKQVELLQNLDPGVGVKDDHPAGVASAYKYLVQRYKDFGKMQAEAGRVDEAIALWDKCADAARGCADKSSEGSSYYQLGLLNNQSQRPEAALGHLERYLEVCSDTEDKAGQGKAHCELGRAKKAQGNTADAITEFERYLELAKELKDEAAENEASALLGRIRSENANHDESLKSLSRSFDIAKGGADSEAVDRARIMLGVATANSMKSSYQKAVTGGLDALLEWKNGRKGL